MNEVSRIPRHLPEHGGLPREHGDLLNPSEKTLPDGEIRSPHDPSQAAEVLLRLEKVCRRFSTGTVPVEAVRNVDLDIFRGEFLVVIGPSGSGKSTLLHLMGGIDRPTGGRIFFGEQELTALSVRDLAWYRRRHVGVIFQFFNLVANLTARENIQLAAELVPNPRDPEEVLRWVGLEDRADHFPSQLSGGEQQRVAVARALVKDPDLLLCDEPTGSLDFAAGKQVLKVLSDLNRLLGKTVILITHNTALMGLGNRIVRLRSGEIVEVRNNPRPLSVEEITW
jgi:putative ABC transport system ATP-binding protein